jgi:hypothetical protein
MLVGYSRAQFYRLMRKHYMSRTSHWLSSRAVESAEEKRDVSVCAVRHLDKG